jgi:hypothetical protein
LQLDSQNQSPTPDRDLTLGEMEQQRITATQEILKKARNIASSPLKSRFNETQLRMQDLNNNTNHIPYKANHFPDLERLHKETLYQLKDISKKMDTTEEKLARLDFRTSVIDP